MRTQKVDKNAFFLFFKVSDKIFHLWPLNQEGIFVADKFFCAQSFIFHKVRCTFLFCLYSCSCFYDMGRTKSTPVELSLHVWQYSDMWGCNWNINQREGSNQHVLYFVLTDKQRLSCRRLSTAWASNNNNNNNLVYYLLLVKHIAVLSNAHFKWTKQSAQLCAHCPIVT